MSRTLKMHESEQIDFGRFRNHVSVNDFLGCPAATWPKKHPIRRRGAPGVSSTRKESWRPRTQTTLPFSYAPRRRFSRWPARYDRLDGEGADKPSSPIGVDRRSSAAKILFLSVGQPRARVC